MSRPAGSLTRCVVLGASGLLLLGVAAGCSLIDGLQGSDEEPFPDPEPDPFPDPPDGMMCIQGGPLFTALTIDDATSPVVSDFEYAGPVQCTDVPDRRFVGSIVRMP